MTEERREEAEKIARHIARSNLSSSDLLQTDILANTTSALLAAEERGARRERQEWRAAVQQFSVVINAVAMTSSPEELRSFIAALPDTFPLPKSCVTDADMQAAIEKAHCIRPQIEAEMAEKGWK